MRGVTKEHHHDETQVALTLVVGAEASVAVVAVGHKVEAEPIFVADDGGRDITARQPERDRETQ